MEILLDSDNLATLLRRILKLITSFIDNKTAVIITTHATHLIDGEKNSKFIRMDNGSLSWERLG